MGTNAETIGSRRGRGTQRIPVRPVGLTLWTAAVAALAAAALIMSVVALTLAARDPAAVTGVAGSGIQQAASTEASPWDQGKLEAMQGRMLAGSVRIADPALLWDPGRLEAMEGRVLAG